jgi:hypothetical protein
MNFKEECIICLDSLLKRYDTHTTQCCGAKINVHRACLKEWDKKENKCLICNKEKVKLCDIIMKRIENIIHSLCLENF